MNKILIIICTIISLTYVNTIAQISDPSPYCNPTVDNNFNMVDYLNLEGQQIDFGPVGVWFETDPYMYYNNVTFPNLTAGGDALLDINFHNSNDIEPGYFSVWIDFNQNNAFETDEIVMQNSSSTMDILPTGCTNTTPLASQNIAIPAAASLGTTRMRLVRGTNLADPYACVYDPAFSITDSCPAMNTGEYGCSYDFDVNIVMGTTSVDDIRNEQFVSIYPNPVHQVLVLEAQEEKVRQLSVYDMLGKEIIHIQGEANELNVEKLEQGNYILSIELSNDKRLVRRITKI